MPPQPFTDSFQEFIDMLFADDDTEAADERDTPPVPCLDDECDLCRPEDEVTELDRDWPVQRGWAPDYLVRAIFDQDQFWITAAGEWKIVAAMAPDHALNTLLFLERVDHDLPIPAESLQHTALYKALYQRVKESLVG